MGEEDNHASGRRRDKFSRGNAGRSRNIQASLQNRYHPSHNVQELMYSTDFEASTSHRQPTTVTKEPGTNTEQSTIDKDNNKHNDNQSPALPRRRKHRRKEDSNISSSE